MEEEPYSLSTGNRLPAQLGKEISGWNTLVASMINIFLSAPVTTPPLHIEVPPSHHYREDQESLLLWCTNLIEIIIFWSWTRGGHAVFFYIPVCFLFGNLNISHFSVCLWECVFFLHQLVKNVLFWCAFFYVLLKTSPRTTSDPRAGSKKKRGPPPLCTGQYIKSSWISQYGRLIVLVEFIL